MIRTPNKRFTKVPSTSGANTAHRQAMFAAEERRQTASEGLRSGAAGDISAGTLTPNSTAARQRLTKIGGVVPDKTPKGRAKQVQGGLWNRTGTLDQALDKIDKKIAEPEKATPRKKSIATSAARE